ncbi:MAG: hypothetical protein IJE21_07520 [Alistipes sp.]|nr:hypothetical protein [Alistipes sp.]
MRVKLFILALLAIVCSSAQAQNFGAPYSSIKCLNVELDGSITVRITGEGRNRFDAKEQARKNAVYEVMFKGVQVENQRNTPLTRPLILEVNAEEKYAEWLSAFFADGGKYKDFVSMNDRKDHTNQKVKKDIQVGWSLTVRIKRAELKAYLEEEGIIKK